MTENNTNSNRNSNSNNIHNDNNRVDNRVDNYDHTESFYIPLMYQENLNKLDRHVSEDLELNTLYSNLYFPNEEDASQTFTLDK